MQYIQRNIINNENYRTRIIWGILLFLALICVIFSGEIVFDIACLFLLIGMMHEWHQITKSNMLFMLLGIIVIPISISSLILIRTLPLGDLNILLYFVLICTTDTFAMLGGKIIQGPKLAPIISPNKTWSGLLSGMITCSLIAVSINYFFGIEFTNNYTIVQLAGSGALFALLEQISDLFISMIKRKFGIKDSGTLIPGHGGILDRCDGIILTAPIMLSVLL